jgi:hypothetical protein
LRCRIDRWIDDLARMFNPVIRGWITYYGRYYKSAMRAGAKIGHSAPRERGSAAE